MPEIDTVFAVLRREVAEAKRITDATYRMGVLDALRNVAIGLAPVFRITRQGAYERAGL